MRIFYLPFLLFLLFFQFLTSIFALYQPKTWARWFMSRRQWRTPTSLPLKTLWSWRTTFMMSCNWRTTFAASWTNRTTLPSVQQHKLLSNSNRLWASLATQTKYEDSSPSSRINKKAYTFTSNIVKISIELHHLWHEEDNVRIEQRKEPIGTHHLLTSHLKWWEETVSLMFNKEHASYLTLYILLQMYLY